MAGIEQVMRTLIRNRALSADDFLNQAAQAMAADPSSYYTQQIRGMLAGLSGGHALFAACRRLPKARRAEGEPEETNANQAMRTEVEVAQRLVEMASRNYDTTRIFRDPITDAARDALRSLIVEQVRICEDMNNNAQQQNHAAPKTMIDAVTRSKHNKCFPLQKLVIQYRAFINCDANGKHLPPTQAEGKEYRAIATKFVAMVEGIPPHLRTHALDSLAGSEELLDLYGRLVATMCYEVDDLQKCVKKSDSLPQGEQPWNDFSIFSQNAPTEGFGRNNYYAILTAFFVLAASVQCSGLVSGIGLTKQQIMQVLCHAGLGRQALSLDAVEEWETPNIALHAGSMVMDPHFEKVFFKDEAAMASHRPRHTTYGATQEEKDKMIKLGKLLAEKEVGEPQQKPCHACGWSHSIVAHQHANCPIANHATHEQV
jgi:hypothetical protein